MGGVNASLTMHYLNTQKLSLAPSLSLSFFFAHIVGFFFAWLVVNDQSPKVKVATLEIATMLTKEKLQKNH